MRMKKSFWIAMGLLSLGVTSCKDDVSFDQETYDELINKAFPVENVDPTHQWATVGVANTAISVNTGTKDTYQVKIYNQHHELIAVFTGMAYRKSDRKMEVDALM